MAKNIFSKLIHLPKFFKIGLIAAIALILWFGYKSITSSQSTSPQYVTSTVTKGTVISSISATGSIAGGNNTTIYTSASGEVIKVYVKNGDKVTQGQKLADLKLDQDAVQKKTTAWAAYLNAVNSAKSAEINKLSLVSAVDSANKSVMDAQNSVNSMNENITNGSGNPSTRKSYTDLEKNSITSTLSLAKQNYEIANQKLAQADSAIATAKAQVSAAWYAYQQSSSTITAPASGTIANFALTPGISIGNLSTDSSSNSNATQSVGVITNPNNQITASVSLTEIDVVKAAPGQKVTLTMDAFPDMTFTGKILAIDTNGQANSGVTSYPTTIVFDSGLPNMYPNMAVSANIITDFKNDVLFVPSTAVQTTDGVSTVKVLKDNQVSIVPVEIGLVGNSDTEIISGLDEFDTIITSTIKSSSTTKTTTGATNSVFSSGMGAGGGQIRMQMIR